MCQERFHCQHTRYGANCVQEHICQRYTKTRKEAMTATRNWKEERATQRRDRNCSTQHMRPSTLKIQTTSIPMGIKPMAQTTNSPSIFNTSLLKVHKGVHVSMSACMCVLARVSVRLCTVTSSFRANHTCSRKRCLKKTKIQTIARN